jgi:hypothetical protein
VDGTYKVLKRFLIEQRTKTVTGNVGFARINFKKCWDVAATDVRIKHEKNEACPAAQGDRIGRMLAQWFTLGSFSKTAEVAKKICATFFDRKSHVIILTKHGLDYLHFGRFCH